MPDTNGAPAFRTYGQIVAAAACVLLIGNRKGPGSNDWIAPPNRVVLGGDNPLTHSFDVTTPATEGTISGLNRHFFAVAHEPDGDRDVRPAFTVSGQIECSEGVRYGVRPGLTDQNSFDSSVAQPPVTSFIVMVPEEQNLAQVTTVNTFVVLAERNA